MKKFCFVLIYMLLVRQKIQASLFGSKRHILQKFYFTLQDDLNLTNNFKTSHCFLVVFRYYGEKYKTQKSSALCLFAIYLSVKNKLGIYIWFQKQILQIGWFYSSRRPHLKPTNLCSIFFYFWLLVWPFFCTEVETLKSSCTWC